MKEYKVGQVVFLIGEKSTRIMPIQVIEEVVRTLDQGDMPDSLNERIYKEELCR